MRRAAIAFGLLAAGLSCAAGLARAQEVSVVSKIRGPAKRGYPRFQRGVEAALDDSGWARVSSQSVATVAINVDVKRVGNRNVARAQLVGVESASVLASASVSWRKTRDAVKAGKKLVLLLIERSVAGARRSEAEPEAEAEIESEGELEPEAVAAEPEPATATEVRAEAVVLAEPAAPVRAAPIVPKDEVEEPVALERPALAEIPHTRQAPLSAAPRTGSGEDSWLHVALAGGAQLLHEYAVSVDGAPTLLGSKLSPTFLANAQLRAGTPGRGPGGELDIAFVPLRYQMSVEPALEPGDPRGRFLDLDGSASYAFAIDEQLYLAPLLGGTYRHFSVDPQVRAESGEEATLLVSSASLALHGGLRAGLRPAENFAVEADGRVRVILGYREWPAQTGEAEGGLGYSFGASARYWFSPSFGASVALRWEHTSVSMSGAGDRSTFAGDPDLVDADISISDLSTSMGLILAL